jgi:glycosyltransferase involved in cell wall biosynthesis
MHEQPLVSILINNYNYGHFLKTAIDSALNQTYDRVEVIVVDDGSTDHSHTIIDQYRDHITPVLQANGGQASAFNAGFLASRGSIICFLDADDSFKPNKIAEVVRGLSQHREAGWFFHQIEIAQEGQILDQSVNPHAAGECDLRHAIHSGNLRGKLPFEHLVTSGLCFQRSLLEKILPMPEEIRITSDDYLKYAAFSLSSGLMLNQVLAQQNIHGENAYTFKPNNTHLKIKTLILTAYWMKQNFPISAKFSDRLLALSLAIRRKWGHQFECQTQVDRYLSASTGWERWEIYCRAFAKVLAFNVRP